jgi:cytochrome c oxidase assembly protein subunit 15
MVTSTSSGLSVPDWPTTYGYSMFSFPLSNMVGGIFYEHGHRLIASTVGFLTIGLVVFLWRVDSRPWMTRLGLVAMTAVILQGVLGGLTVLYSLPAPVSIGHAALAQMFFCLIVGIALFTSPEWLNARAASAIDDGQLRRLALIVTILIYVQILIGATMRHLGAGLAIPDFPLSFGHVLPPAWPLPVAIHFAHRVGALVITLLTLATAWAVWSRHRNRPQLTRPAVFLVAAVATQATLGALVVLSRRQPIPNTLHVVTGAVVLGAALVLTLRTYRVRFNEGATGRRPRSSGPSALALGTEPNRP